MATVGNLRDRILRLLDDPSNNAGYTDESIGDAINSALDAILPWTPKLGTFTIVGTGASSYLLPTSLYEIQSVISNDTGQSINRATLSPGSYHGDYTESLNDWILYPSGYISFSKALEAGTDYTLFYTSSYTEVTVPLVLATALEPPNWTITALAYYSASVMLVPQAISAATIRQFNTRVDSGTPEQNPMQKSVTFLQSLFIQEMNRNPKYQKVSV